MICFLDTMTIVQKRIVSGGLDLGQISFLFFNPHLRMCLLILEREKHRCESKTLIGCLPCMPRLGIEPTSFWCTG